MHSSRPSFGRSVDQRAPRRGRGELEAEQLGEGAYHAGAPADLAHDPFERVTGPDATPVLFREGVVRQGL